jgi:hypothetical protein
VENYVSCWGEKQELKESIQDLLHHLIIFLLSSQKVLEQLDQV